MKFGQSHTKSDKVRQSQTKLDKVRQSLKNLEKVRKVKQSKTKSDKSLTSLTKSENLEPLFSRQLPEHPYPITTVHMNEVSGDVVSAAKNHLYLWTINGELVAQTSLATSTVIQVIFKSIRDSVCDT